MKKRLVKILPLLLAGTLELMPLMRSMLPTVTQGLPPSGGGIIFRWAIGAIALLGFDAISSASSIAISPPNATAGQPYVGTVTYSGGHAGGVRSITYSGTCLNAGQTAFVNGLSVTYNGGNTVSVSGTPTGAGSFSFSLTVWSGSTCNGGDRDTRSTALVVAANGGGGVAPSFGSPPQNVTAQVGSDALLSGGASGTPAPGYNWYIGPPLPANWLASGSTLDFPSVGLGNAGLYTVVATNASGSASATCYLSVCLTPGDNPLALNYTNHHPIGAAVTLSSSIATVPAANNSYQWRYNNGDIPGATANNLGLNANQVTSSKSGVYAVVFNSVAGAQTIVNQQEYYSFWAFGAAPTFTTQPQGGNASVGDNVTLTAQATVSATPYGASQSLHFAWYRDTTLVFSQDGTGASQTSTLSLTSVATTDSGNYTVVVTDEWGSTTSSVAALTVSAGATAPSITVQPMPQSVIAGQNASFTVTATGTAPLSYQWKKDNADLADGGHFSGVTTTTLTITGAQAGDAGNYSVVVANTAGSVPSAAAALTVLVPPSISSQPQSVTVTNGGNATFAVAATGTAPLSYQWYKGSTMISGANMDTYTVMGATPGDAGSYSVTVANSAGSAPSSPAMLSVLVAPAIVTQPVGSTITNGDNVTFSVVATGTPAPTYQWSKDGTMVVGATDSSYAITGATASQAGNYTVAVANSVQSILSMPATLTVLFAPSISSQPQNLTVTEGGSASFSVTASGNPAPSYQWYKDSALLAGATTSDYTIAGVMMSQAGGYDVVVANSIGSVTSLVASLTVQQQVVPPSIVTQPASLTVTNGGNASFSVMATGTAPLAYQWYKATVMIPGATMNTYTVNGATPGDAGSYSVTVANSAGSAPSMSATLTVLVGPAILTQPQDLTVTTGGTATFSVAASGNPAPSYQWYKDGALLSGATTSDYAITGATMGQAGGYDVVVANSVGSVTSVVATLTVQQLAVPPAIVTQPAGLTVTNGGAASFSVIATGTSLTYQWYKDNVMISGAAAAIFTIPSAGASDAGGYTVVVANSLNSVTSLVATLVVLLPPAITTQPVSVTVSNGASANFSVVATGTAPLSYQWQFKGANVTGATSSSLALSNVQQANEGDYLVVVSNAAGSLNSSVAHLTVQTGVSTPIQLGNPQVVGGTFSFDIAGPGPGSYVISRSLDLVIWTPVATNSTASGALHFSDSQATANNGFYRVSAAQ